MRYRRLGRTEWMVSEVGLALRALEGIDEAAAGATLGAATASGVTLLLVDVREHEGGVEPLVGRVMAGERPRLVAVSRFERLAEPAAFAAQLQAAGARLSDDGYLDVALFKEIPDPPHREVLERLAVTRGVRAWGVETDEAAFAARAFEDGATVVVTPAPASDALLAAAARAGAGVIVAGPPEEVAASLADPRVTSAVAEAATPAEMDTLVRAAISG